MKKALVCVAVIGLLCASVIAVEKASDTKPAVKVAVKAPVVEKASDTKPAV